jgi:hypothetical protein
MIRSFEEVPSPVPDATLGMMVSGKCLVAGFKMLNGGGVKLSSTHDEISGLVRTSETRTSEMKVLSA